MSADSEMRYKHGHVIHEFMIITMAIWPFSYILLTLFFTLSIQHVRRQSQRWVFQAIFKHKSEFVRNLLGHLSKNLLEPMWKSCLCLSCHEGKAPGVVTSSALHFPVSSCPSTYTLDSFQAASFQPRQWCLTLSARWWVREQGLPASEPLLDLKKVGEAGDQQSFPGCF